MIAQRERPVNRPRRKTPRIDATSPLKNLGVADKLVSYGHADGELPSRYAAWPLYGAGVEQLGRDGQPVTRSVPEPGPDEILVRNDAVGLCFSDVKVIQMGAEHPRLVGRDLAANPIVPGHEASITVVAVGSALHGQYAVGQRFAVQPDIWLHGRSLPYGYSIDGGFQEYGILGPAVLAGDAGSYLVPVGDALGYAAAALTEPWACVEASYRIAYRTALKPGGRVWVAAGAQARAGYHFERIWDAARPPAEVVASHLPDDLLARLRARCAADGVALTVQPAARLAGSDARFDDILLPDGDAALWAAAAPHLAYGGVLALVSADPSGGRLALDLGRIHYDDIFYTGAGSLNLDDAYLATPARPALRPGGVLWAVGAGGAMGRMHVQRAITAPQPPRLIVASEPNSVRARDLAADFGAEAERRGVTLRVLASGADDVAAGALLDAAGGADDVEVLAADPAAVAATLQHLAPGGMVNLFAGLKRGVSLPVDVRMLCGRQQARLIGHSGSGLDDQIAVVQRATAGHLLPERSVVAIGGLAQVPDGVRAMLDGRFAGKVVLYPAIPDLPLLALADMRARLPQVHAKLAEGRFWTAEAEQTLLSLLLPE